MFRVVILAVLPAASSALTAARPIGAFNVNHDGPRYEFIERPLVSTEIIPATLSEAGLGVHGRLTATASRMACLAGIHEPFRKAERLLGELCGWSADAETIRRLCHHQAKAARRQRGDREGLPEATVGHCDVRVTIPVREGAESLNVAAAAAIALHRISMCEGAPHMRGRSERSHPFHE